MGCLMHENLSHMFDTCDWQSDLNCTGCAYRYIGRASLMSIHNSEGSTVHGTGTRLVFS